MVWPENLIEELAYRRCIIFIGAGISSTAKNASGETPVIWEDFLKKAVSLIGNQNPEDREFIDLMIKQENYLMALQAISDLVDKGRYGKFIYDVFEKPNFGFSDVHEAIKSIDSKILITTNFDNIYDRLCNVAGYSTFTYRDTTSIINKIKSPTNIIIKAHGTINEPDHIIFTAKQYYEAQKNYPNFYELLRSLFLTHTVLFLGYSLSDPDINLILQNTSNTSSELAPHYILVKKGISNHKITHWNETYNVVCLEGGNTYDEVNKKIIELDDLVRELREERQLP